MYDYRSEFTRPPPSSARQDYGTITNSANPIDDVGRIRRALSGSGEVSVAPSRAGGLGDGFVRALDDVDVAGQHYDINPHLLNSLRKSGRRHIDPESLIRSLDTVPSPGTPGSRVFTDPTTGTRWFVNDSNSVVGVWPEGFKR